MDDARFWVQMGQASGQGMAALLRLLRYGNADQHAWHQLRGALKLAYDAIGERFTSQKMAEHASVTIDIAQAERIMKP